MARRFRLIFQLSRSGNTMMSVSMVLIDNEIIMIKKAMTTVKYWGARRIKNRIDAYLFGFIVR